MFQALPPEDNQQRALNRLASSQVTQSVPNMSQADLQKFLKAIRDDPSLQEKLRAAGADPIAIAAEVGYTITRPEAIRAEAARIQKLSDEELESAAGGANSPSFRNSCMASCVVCRGGLFS